MKKICENCKKEKEHHGKGYCYYCYKKIYWKPKKKECKRCKRLMALHAKGLCPGCYNFVFNLEKAKKQNRKKLYNISEEMYFEITKKCFICEFDKIIDLHHLDGSKKNNSRENLIGLCPNHHKMIHDFRFRKEIRAILLEKGINLPDDPKLEFQE